MAAVVPAQQVLQAAFGENPQNLQVLHFDPSRGETALCRIFLRRGACKWGDLCRHSHEMDLSSYSLRARRGAAMPALVQGDPKAALETASENIAFVLSGPKAVYDFEDPHVARSFLAPAASDLWAWLPWELAVDTLWSAGPRGAVSACMACKDWGPKQVAQGLRERFYREVTGADFSGCTWRHLCDFMLTRRLLHSARGAQGERRALVDQGCGPVVHICQPSPVFLLFLDGAVTFALLRSGEVRCHRSSTGQILGQSTRLGKGRQLQAAALLGCEAFVLGDDQGGLVLLLRDDLSESQQLRSQGPPGGVASMAALQENQQGAEWFFGLAFSGELLLKLGGLRCGFFKDPWNYLDVLIVMFWIIDVLPLDPMLIRILRLAKLLRLVKLAKSIKSFDSLYLLTASIASSASALVWSGVLICIVQLSVALVLSTFLLPYCTDLSIPEGDRFEVYRYFGTFSRSMLSMFELTLGNWVPISRILSEKVSEWYTIFTLAFQVILGFAVIKVITGVFLTETMKVASMDDSIMLKSKERAVRLHKEKMSRLFARADLDANGGIDCVEFHSLLADREVRQWLASMELEIFSEQDGDALFAMIDDGDGIVTLDELVKGVARLKGQARNVDLALMNKRLIELKQDLLEMQHKQFERLIVFNEETPGGTESMKHSI